MNKHERVVYNRTEAWLGVVGASTPDSVPAGTTNDFAARKCLVKGREEKFNAVSFYLPLQLMPIQSKRGSPNKPVCFRYTRLSS